jgi:ribosomal protein S18 acetylase RimI-like enzyme
MQGLSTTAQIFQFRPAQAADEPFLFALFAESQQHLALAQAPAEWMQSLIVMQYRGRAMSYAAQYPQAEDFILLGEQGESLGRMLIDRSTTRWRIVDIAVLQAWRGNGIGKAAIHELQRQAAEADASIGLNVLPTNPARRLYEREGFQAEEESSSGVEMVWTASPLSASYRKALQADGRN